MPFASHPCSAFEGVCFVRCTIMPSANPHCSLPLHLQPGEGAAGQTEGRKGVVALGQRGRKPILNPSQQEGWRLAWKTGRPPHWPIPKPAGYSVTCQLLLRGKKSVFNVDLLELSSSIPRNHRVPRPSGEQAKARFSSEPRLLGEDCKPFSSFPIGVTPNGLHRCPGDGETSELVSFSGI